MNGKIKAAMITAVVLGLAVSAIYAVPTFAYMKGTMDLTRDRDMDRVRDRDCVYDCVYDCDCARDQNQTRTRLHLQECAQVETSIGPATLQHQYEYQYQWRHQNMRSP